MAKLADAADLKSAGPKGLWGFDSPSRHQLTPRWAAQCWAWRIRSSALRFPEHRLRAGILASRFLILHPHPLIAEI